MLANPSISPRFPYRGLWLAVVMSLWGSLSVAQTIWEPDGLRLPGVWNGWANTHGMGGDFDMTRIDRAGYLLWTTTFQESTSSGNKDFLFVSGPTGNEWTNKWANTTMNINVVVTNISWNCGSCPDNTIATTNGKYYTANWHDQGYNNTEAVIMETTNPPQTFSATNPISPAIPQVAPGQDLFLTVHLTGNKSPEEKVFIRYTDDGFSTSSLAEVTFATSTSSSGTATIPGSFHTPGKSVYFYAYTTTVSATTDSPHDLIAIELANNGGLNYAYTVKSSWVSINTGQWNNANTWETQGIPPDNQPITISDNTVVTINIPVVNGSDITIKPIGKLILNTNDTLRMKGFFHNQNGVAGFQAGNGSVVHFTRGGYLEGPFEFYNLQVGNDAAPSDIDLYIVNNIALRYDLVIAPTGRLFTGTSSGDGSLTFTGTAGSLYNSGQLYAENGTKQLHINFAPGSNTILRSNSLSPAKTEFNLLQIAAGATVSADASGTLGITFTGDQPQIVNHGTLNFLNSFGGVSVNIAPGNTLTMDLSAALETLFSTIEIGDGAMLRPANGTTVDLTLTRDLNIYGDIQNSQDNTGKFYVKFIGADPQIIRTENGKTAAEINFADFTVDNDTLVRMTEKNGVAPSTKFAVSGEFNLLRGVFRTVDTLSAGLADDIRFDFTILDKSLMNLSGTVGQNTTSPEDCYVEGPLHIRTNDNAAITFPLGGGGDYRTLKIIPAGVSGDVTFNVEHFDRSANFTGMALPSGVLNISDLRFWNVKVDYPENISSVQFTLAYGDFDSDGVSSETDLRVVWAEQDASTDGDPLNNKWFDLGPATGGAGYAITSDAFSFENNPDLGGRNLYHIDITLGNVQAHENPLPVEWLYFQGHRLSDVNILTWATGSEQNSDRFFIERSEDGRAFHDIGTVPAQGYVAGKTEYRFTDEDPFPDLNYYRLRQVDRDGAIGYSEIIALRGGTKEVKIYPIPFDDFIVVDAKRASRGSFVLVDAGGQTLLQGLLTQERHVLDTSNLPAGFYTIRISDDFGQDKVVKLVK